MFFVLGSKCFLYSLSWRRALYTDQVRPNYRTPLVKTDSKHRPSETSVADTRPPKLQSRFYRTKHKHKFLTFLKQGGVLEESKASKKNSFFWLRWRYGQFCRQETPAWQKSRELLFFFGPFASCAKARRFTSRELSTPKKSSSISWPSSVFKKLNFDVGTTLKGSSTATSPWLVKMHLSFPVRSFKWLFVGVVVVAQR